MPVLVREGTRKNLGLVFKDLNYTEGVEIGVRRGGFGRVLLRLNPNLHYTGVDPWKAIGTRGLKHRQEKQDLIYSDALEVLKPFEDRVTLLRMPSMEAVTDFKEMSIDFVFIDGAHDFDNVMLDIIHWSYKVKPGGIIACHDYMAGQSAGVMQAVDAYTHCHNIYPWYVTRERLPTAFWVVPEHRVTRPF